MHFKNVLSCFDGISCGQLALVRAGHTYDNYYASEVDKYAIKITLKNFPQTIQLGDIKSVWSRNLPPIDLIMGGSPCQDLSIAGKRAGLGGERSGLFWHFVRLVRTCKPKYFLLENVASMTKENRDIISEALGVEPILINSALVSAQQRKRLYWTNIPGITQPQDKGILLQDIIERDHNLQAEPITKRVINNIRTLREKSKCLSASCYKGAGNNGMTNIPICVDNINPSGRDMNGRVFSVEGKSCTLTTNKGEGQKIFINIPDGEYTIRKLTPIECERLQTLPDNYTEKGFETLSQIFYNGNECNVEEDNNKWNCAELKAAISQSQVGKLNYAINTILDGLGMEIPTLKENLRIKAKNVKSKGAEENVKRLKVFALSTIKNGKEDNLLTKIKDVRFAINPLGKGVAECVLSITNNGKNTEMLYTMKNDNICHTGIEIDDTIKPQTVIGFIKLLQKKILEENSTEEKLYIILTLINLIIIQAIFMSAKITEATYLYIDSLNKSQENSLEMELSFLKMGNIKGISNQNRYKAIGNGWTVDVIAHIFSFIKE